MVRWSVDDFWLAGRACHPPVGAAGAVGAKLVFARLRLAIADRGRANPAIRRGDPAGRIAKPAIRRGDPAGGTANPAIRRGDPAGGTANPAIRRADPDL